jgi:excisionase family DNA binding protein
MRKLLTVSEAAEILNLSASCIYKKAERGELESIKIGSTLRFAEESICEFIERCKIPKWSETSGETTDVFGNTNHFM